MTREHVKSMLPIMAAFSEGKAIQIATVSGWKDIDENPDFDAHPSVYRVKPEPRDFWIMPHAGFGCGLALEHKPDGQSIHVREVE